MPSISSATPTKVCTGCQLPKPLTDFYRNKGKRAGYEERCKPCFVAAQTDRKPGLPYQPHPHTGLAHPDRFWAKVEKSEGCWIWTAALNQYGYGLYNLGRRSQLAHRVAYEMAHGAIPPGLVLDHLCRNSRCVNPSHLEAVTLGENTIRGVGPTTRRAATHCKRGHPFDDANTFWDNRGYRHCRACTRASGAANMRKYRQRR